MEIFMTAIGGIIIIAPRIFEDVRVFFQLFSQREFDEMVA